PRPPPRPAARRPAPPAPALAGRGRPCSARAAPRGRRTAPPAATRAAARRPPATARRRPLARASWCLLWGKFGTCLFVFVSAFRGRCHVASVAGPRLLAPQRHRVLDAEVLVDLTRRVGAVQRVKMDATYVIVQQIAALFRRPVRADARHRLVVGAAADGSQQLRR